MTETKFTPGPWRWYLCGPYSGDLMAGSDFVIEYVDCEGMSFGFLSKDQNEANANLIAAAPELYEALVAVLGLTENTYPFGGELQADRINRTLENARTVLAKARGEK